MWFIKISTVVKGIKFVVGCRVLQDQYLFFRFYDDEKHGQQDSYQVGAMRCLQHSIGFALIKPICMQDAPVGARRRWRFRPTNITLSVILTSKLAKVRVHPIMLGHTFA